MGKRLYIAEKNKVYRRKSDGHIMRNRIILGNFADGTPDVIENYEEVVDENPRRDHRRPMSPRERMLERRNRTKR